MLKTEYLAGLGREDKAGIIEGRLFKMAVLEPSSKVLEVLEVLSLLGKQGEQLAWGWHR